MKPNAATHAERLVFAAVCFTPLIAGASTPASPWEFRVEPYGWFTAIDGSTGPNASIAEVDASFKPLETTASFRYFLPWPI